MTGATPETRLVLITWLARFGTKIQAGHVAELDTLNLSKRHVKEALEYLTREGYLWKTKSLLPSAQEIKSKEIFDHGVTADCRAMWSESFIACNSWAMELLYVLTSTKLLKSKFNDISNNISAEMRLVWAVMISRANPAGYVIQQDGQELIKMVGMNEGRFRRIVQALAKAGCISVAANGVAPSVIFNRLEPIYKIHPQRPGQKIIKLAFPLVRDAITPFRFIIKLKDGGNRARKGRFSGIEDLSNEHCYELSKIICSSQFSAALHQLGMSIILSFLPNYAAARYPDAKTKEISNELRKTLLAKLEVDIRSMLSERLLDSSLLAYERRKTKEKVFEESDIAHLKSFVLSGITNELLWIIEDLSKGWKIYTESVGGAVQLINCLSGEYWIHVNQKCDESEIKEQSEDFHETLRKFDHSVVRVVCILEVCVPDDIKHDDCMVIDDELWTINSRVKDANIHHVEQLIVRQKGHF